MLRRRRRRAKEEHELAYWRERRALEGELGAGHYEHFFTAHFGIERSAYAGKRMLDVGCGPRGSLEWATDAAERVGLDPLAEAYRELGTGRHAMQYVAGAAEDIPFGDGHFDVVSSLNSLDHVDDLERAARELTRVLAPRGTLLVVTEIGHPPTPTEPQEFGAEVLDLFTRDLELVAELRHPFVEGAGVLGSALGEPGPATGGREVLSARLRRVA
jgi:SAM-dependent methyltransferase